jgi:hypothetical protein
MLLIRYCTGMGKSNRPLVVVQFVLYTTLSS